MYRRGFNLPKIIGSGHSKKLPSILTARSLSLNNPGTLDLPKYLIDGPITRITSLDNGIRVTTQSYRCETTTVGVYINAGSAYEKGEINGTAHFLEHMIFKGTQNRSGPAIELEVENIGGQLNAYTSREHTVYLGKSLSRDAYQMTDILSDILQNSLLRPEHIERERNVILTEKRTVEMNFEEVVFDYMHSAAYKESGLSKTILGEESDILRIGKEDLMNYISKHYTGNRLVISAAGGIDHEKLVETVQKLFGNIPYSSPNFDFTKAINEPAPFVPSQILVRAEGIDEIFCAVGYEAVPWLHPSRFAFIVLISHLGAWERNLPTSSPMSKVVEMNDLALSYNTFYTCYNQTALFGTYFITRKEKFDEMAQQVSLQYKRALDISPENLERAKNRAKAGYLTQLDGSTPISEELGKYILFLGRNISPHEVFRRIDAVTIDDLKDIVNNYFIGVDPVVSAIGNIDEKTFPAYNSWKERTLS